MRGCLTYVLFDMVVRFFALEAIVLRRSFRPARSLDCCVVSIEICGPNDFYFCLDCSEALSMLLFATICEVRLFCSKPVSSTCSSSLRRLVCDANSLVIFCMLNFDCLAPMS